jgi:hypothetical protein
MDGAGLEGGIDGGGDDGGFQAHERDGGMHAASVSTGARTRRRRTSPANRG